jgi:hypothetical protein
MDIAINPIVVRYLAVLLAMRLAERPRTVFREP